MPKNRTKTVKKLKEAVKRRKKANQPNRIRRIKKELKTATA